MRRLCRFYFQFVVWFVVALATCAAATPLVWRGEGEFTVNTFVANAQQRASVAMRADGSFVIVWMSELQDGDARGIYGQRFDKNGGRQGGEFRINTTTANHQRQPAVAMDADGNFVVVWSSYAQDGDGEGIYGQRFNSAGVRQGGEFRVNTTTANEQTWPTVAMAPSGEFVVIWTSSLASGHDLGVYGQRYDNAGVPQGGEFLVADDYGLDFRASVGMDAKGDFTVVWAGYATNEVSSEIYGLRFNADGSRKGDRFRANTYTSGTQWQSKVAVRPDGSFVVAWANSSDGDPNNGIYLRSYNADGSARSEPFRVNTSTESSRGYPSVAVNAGGVVVVVWQSNNQGSGNQCDLYGRYYNAAGEALGDEFTVNVPDSHLQFAQDVDAVALNASGDFVVTWEGFADGNGYDIFAQRFLVPHAPLVTTNQVADLKSSNATFSATIEPGGAETQYYFEYGATTEYGNVLPMNSAPANHTPYAVSVQSGTLRAHSTYHVRAVAQSSLGTTQGNDITFTTLNSTPRADDDSFHPVAGSGAHTFSVRDNDSDPDGDTLTISSVSGSAKGTVSTDGLTISYVPGVAFDGRDTFTYTLVDGFGGTSVATVTLNNAAPTPRADSISTTFRTAVEVPVLANDSDPDGDAISLSAVTQGANGSVSLSGSVITYTPSPIFYGNDSFTYTIRDSFGRAATATVNVSVSAPPFPIVTAVASTGGAIPDAEAGTAWKSFGVPSINDSGKVAFAGTLKLPTGATQSGVFAGMPITAVALQGDVAPIGATATAPRFKYFRDPVLNNSGEIAFSATLAGTPADANTGIWRWSGNSLTLIALEGMEPEGVPGGKFESFTSLALPETGRAVFIATLRVGKGGVKPSSRHGVWAEAPAGGLKLVIRDGQTLEAGGVLRTVKSFVLLAPVKGSPGQRRSFDATGNLALQVNFTDGMRSLFIAREDGSLMQLAGRGDSVAALNGGQLDDCGIPALASEDGSVAFVATSKSKSAASPRLSSAILNFWIDGQALSKVAASGDNVPGVPGTRFRSFLDPLCVSRSTGSFVAMLERGIGGVSAKNDSGLWLWSENEMSLVAREGNSAPGLQGGYFSEFLSMAMPGPEGGAFTANLRQVPGVVTAANDTGLWTYDSQGLVRLVLREGDSIPVGPDATGQVKSFTVLAAVPGSAGQGHCRSSTQFLIRVYLKGGRQALLNVRMP